MATSDTARSPARSPMSPAAALGVLAIGSHSCNDRGRVSPAGGPASPTAGGLPRPAAPRRPQPQQARRSCVSTHKGRPSARPTCPDPPVAAAARGFEPERGRWRVESNHVKLDADSRGLHPPSAPDQPSQQRGDHAASPATIYRSHAHPSLSGSIRR